MNRTPKRIFEAQTSARLSERSQHNGQNICWLSCRKTVGTSLHERVFAVQSSIKFQSGLSQCKCSLIGLSLAIKGRVGSESCNMFACLLFICSIYYRAWVNDRNTVLNTSFAHVVALWSNKFLSKSSHQFLGHHYSANVLVPEWKMAVQSTIIFLSGSLQQMSPGWTTDRSTMVIKFWNESL